MLLRGLAGQGGSGLRLAPGRRGQGAGPEREATTIPRYKGGSQPRTAALRLVAGFPPPAPPRKRGRNEKSRDVWIP